MSRQLERHEFGERNQFIPVAETLTKCVLASSVAFVVYGSVHSRCAEHSFWCRRGWSIGQSGRIVSIAPAESHRLASTFIFL